MSRHTIGIRREDKHEWERRAPLTPDAVRAVVDDEQIDVVVQTSPIRVYPDADYAAAGATLTDAMPEADVVFAVKEIPLECFRAGGAYVFFSHTIKGQPHSMPMLRRMMELGCTLIDYEPITDDDGRRLVFFGRHAGLAGMIDTLWLVGQRLEALGIKTPFWALRLAHEYASLDEALAHVRDVGDAIRRDGLPDAITPFVCGITGYGNVSLGAQTVYDALGGRQVDPQTAATLAEHRTAEELRSTVYKVVFRNRDIFQPEDGSPFVRTDYFANPGRYRSVFDEHLPSLTVLVNAIYWAAEAPRLVTNAWLRDAFAASTPPRLRVIGDISCDIDGGVECTVKPTTPGAPAYVYDPKTGAVADGVTGPGIAMMTTDCLPCELPREATASFTDALLPFVPAIANANYDGPLEDAGLPPEIERAVVLWRGALTPRYSHLETTPGDNG